jgi:adenylosuccinate synthase
MPAFIVVGLGYGDEGKGAVVDHLVRQHKAGGVVFANGGAQRAHNVVLPDGRSHTFSQFSSGTFAGATTYHSRYSMVNPHALFVEWEALRKLGFWPAKQIRVQEDAIITTPFHIALNRIREKARGKNGHGTCGMGIGETVLDSLGNEPLRARDLQDPKTLYGKLHDIQRRLRTQAHKIIARADETMFFAGKEANTLADYAAIKDCMEIYRIFAKVVPLFGEFDFDPDDAVIFEGSQGVLLDEFYGFHPHTTWSKTTDENALKLLFPNESVGDMNTTTIGVMRSYMTRHGAGPFITEDPSLAERFPEAHNASKGWQGAWRVGWTDLAALAYSLACLGGKVDELAVTHLDRVQGDWKVCVGYSEPIVPPFFDERKLWENDRNITLNALNRIEPKYIEFEDMHPADLLAVIEATAELPVTIEGSGPTAYMSEAVAA